MQEDLKPTTHTSDEPDATARVQPQVSQPPSGFISISMRREHIPLAIGMLVCIGVACLLINAAISYYAALYVVSRPAQWAALSIPTTAPLPTVLPEPTIGIPLTARPMLPTAPIAAPAPPDVENTGIARMGQDVQVGDARWKVVDAKDEGQQLKADSTQFSNEATTTGKFIRVRFEVENTGTEQRQFNSVSLSDQNGKSYSSTSNVAVLTHIATGERCGSITLNPNVSRTCEVLFDIPVNATNLKFIINSLDPLAGGTDEILLNSLVTLSATVQPLFTAVPAAAYPALGATTTSTP